ncbi:MAG: class I SAM-dependent methyltransferase [Flavobacteriales bacterium]
MILILYTTRYRQGSPMFKRAAETLAGEKAAVYKGPVLCRGIVHKKEVSDLFRQLAQEGKPVDEYHFVGHSGMYGPMYGTQEYPEQFSPHEWQQMHIPFAAGARAYFHCCRSARWFAPFFARTFSVETFGYYWYTGFSRRTDYFGRVRSESDPVYAIGCKGRKSHGIIGSLKKYTRSEPLEKMRSFSPAEFTEDRSYDKVAALYDAVFQDIKVRRDEWNWLCRHLPSLQDKTVLDIGCGNGALLKELAPKVRQGIGVDVSAGILEKAAQMHAQNPNIAFHRLQGPVLPLADQSVDIAVSLLSFRYLDWDPLMAELKRVLKPGGRILIVDMITVPVKKREIPVFLRHKLQMYIQKYRERHFQRSLSELVNHPDWKHMIKYNPIRAEHEMKWYLESRFPGRRTEKINIGWNASILAFDSGPIEHMNTIHLTYP